MRVRERQRGPRFPADVVHGVSLIYSTARQPGFVGRHGDPWTGTKRNTHGVTRFVSDDRHVLELYEPGTDGKEFKVLEITYTKQ